jgi:mono/diheme cytochrome c family protein
MKTRYAVWTVVVVLVGLAAYAGSVVRRGFSAKDQPSVVESFVARTVRNFSLAASTRNLKDPLPATTENVHEGLEHFADHCAFCHANDGSGDSDTGRNLYPKPPDLRKRQTQGLTDGQIYSVIANGVRLTGMPASDHDVDDNWRLVLFVRHLPDLTATERTEMESLNHPSEDDEEHHHSGDGLPLGTHYPEGLKGSHSH